jgi:F0F1-type ATP synthase assembly protein I
VHDPVAAGRRTAYRAIAVQAAVVGLVAAAFLFSGTRQALSAAVGGMALVAGHLLVAALALGGGVVPAPAAFGRLLLGLLGKWLLVVVAVAIALEAWRLPPLPMLAGLVAGLLAYHVALQVLSSNRLNRDKR